jgi:hypothetical protein
MYVAYREDTKEIIAQSERIEYLSMYENEYGICPISSAALGTNDGLWFGSNVTEWHV